MIAFKCQRFLREHLNVVWPIFARPILFLIITSLATWRQWAHFSGFQQVEIDSGSSGYRSSLAPWDASHYLHLAFDGYSKNDPSCAFYPLWPLILRVLYWAVPVQSAWPAWITANILSISACLLFIVLLRRVVDDLTAKRTVWLFLASPGALFFSTLYSEPVFLLLSISLFFSLEKRNYLLASVCAFLLPLTRAVGIFALAPLVWHAWRGRSNLRRWAVSLLPIAGYLTYLYLMARWTGNPFEGFKAQESYPTSPSISNMFDLTGFARNLVNISGFHSIFGSALDRIFFCIFLISLPLVWRVRQEWFWWALLTGLVPAMTSAFMSYTRYIASDFPVFVVLAQWFRYSNPVWFWCYLIVLGVTQMLLIYNFAIFEWAG